MALMVIFTAEYVHSRNKSVSCLGYSGDTIELDEVSNLYYSSWSVKECPDKYDYEHVTTLYRVKDGALVYHNQTITFQSGHLHTTHPSRDVGLLEYLYVLQGSHINYTICLSSEHTSQLNGKLYIFNNVEDIRNFVNEINNGSAAVYQQNVTIGTNNQTVCTSIRYVFSRTAYYFVTVALPKGVAYVFNYTVFRRYLNGSDYDELCRVSLSHQCNIGIPNSQEDKYILLGSIEYIPPTIVVYPTTHICVTRNNSFVVSGLVFGGVGLLIMVLAVTVCVVLCVSVQFCTRYKYHKRGYIAVQTTIN